jgi:hypothetical protein
MAETGQEGVENRKRGDRRKRDGRVIEVRKTRFLVEAHDTGKVLGT